MEQRALRLASYLVNELGLKKGDRAAFLSENNIAFLDAFFMGCKTGIIITTYNYLLSSNEILNFLRAEEPKVVFYAGSHHKIIADLRMHYQNCEYIAISGDSAPEDMHHYHDIMSCEGEPLRCEPPTIEDTQMLIHTGGTTGWPKAAMLSYRSVYQNTVGSILTLGHRNTDIAHVYLPFFHTAAWHCLMLSLLMVGGKIILTPRFCAETALEVIRTERPTHGIAVETVYKSMIACPAFKSADFSCFEWMLNGAAPISRPTMEAFWEKGVPLVNAYGMTEIGPCNLTPPVPSMSLDEIRSKWNSVGKPMFFNHVKIVDEEGRDVKEGEPGELLFKGSLTFSGYWRDEEKTNGILKEGWICTGDIARKDGDGYYYICGRRKNMFISGGENIFPVEIEHVLCGHPAIESACVFGVPDDKWQEVGKALIVLKEKNSLTQEELREWIAGRISRIKIPKYIEFVSEIPHNTLGKRDIAVIRKQYGGI
jgi:fatty-acyl-CoA synthase